MKIVAGEEKKANFLGGPAKGGPGGGGRAVLGEGRGEEGKGGPGGGWSWGRASPLASPLSPQFL